MSPQPIDSFTDGLLTVAEAAAFLRLSRAKLYSLMDAGRLAYVRFDRCRRVPRAAVVAFATAHLVGDRGSAGDGR